MNFIIRLFMTFSSVSFFLVVYLVQNKIDILPIINRLTGVDWIFICCM